ncbi:hypothetical protein Pla110_02660 [Polystyrenella longa]|uniref:DUF3160 domain-containing protein n=1 Tax=Polystyrenella longa TaxID=2528007 RepID=A0A518CH62_9PLAN|nr:hypothetical protein [Polystyrenella longa]QDU78562.1 hypothetical protein Pla110_02660 [Polystyrenella longa]
MLSKLYKSRFLKILFAGLLFVTVFVTVSFYCWRSWRVHSIPDVGEPFDVAAFKNQTGDGEEIARITIEASKQWDALCQKHEDVWFSYYNDTVQVPTWKAADPVIKTDVRNAQTILTDWFRVGELRPGLLRSLDVYYDNIFNHDRVRLAQRDLARLTEMSLLDAIERSDFDQQQKLYINFLSTNSAYLHDDVMNYLTSTASLSVVIGDRLGIFLNQQDIPVSHLWKLKSALERHQDRQPPVSTYFKYQYLAAPALIEYYAVSESVLAQRILDEDESTRRLLNLLFANWLRYCDLPASERPPIKTFHLDIFVPPSSINEIKEGMTTEIEFEYFDDSNSDQITDYWKIPSYPQQIRLNLLISNTLESLLNAWKRSQMKEELYLTRLALHLYYRDHDQFPETLNELVPKYLRSVPLNYNDGTPVEYSLENDTASLKPHDKHYAATITPPGSDL